MEKITPQTIGEQLCAYLERIECTAKDLARQTDLSFDTIREALANDGTPTLRTRCAIEAALGRAFWSTEAEFERRKHEAKLIGFAPEVASLKQLKRRAVQLRVKGYGLATNKPDLAAMILRELAVREDRQRELEAQMQADLCPDR